MAYLIGNNNQASVLHVCRDLSGAPLTGQAGSITTALFDPNGASSAITVTVSEIGTTGFYTVALTPNATGRWLLRVTNPAPTTADGLTTDYALDVKGAAAVAAATTRNLTTRARVKERMTIPTATATFDNVLDSLISEVSNMIQDRIGRTITEDTFTEYYDGTGGERLILRQGPLVSVTSVDSVAYSGTSTRVETLTTVNAADYVEEGLRSEGWTGRATLRLLGGTWVPGRRNYKVVYVAGWATVPEGLVHIATNWVVSAFLLREAKGLDTKAVGEASVDPAPLTELSDAIDRATEPYVFYAGIA